MCYASSVGWGRGGGFGGKIRYKNKYKIGIKRRGLINSVIGRVEKCNIKVK